MISILGVVSVKKGKVKKKKKEIKTPIGYFSIENLYYRSDRIKKPFTDLKCIKIKKIWDGAMTL